jgi:hypothetical protein
MKIEQTGAARQRMVKPSAESAVAGMMLVYSGQIFDDGGVAGLHSGSRNIEGLLRDLDQASSIRIHFDKIEDAYQGIIEE